MRSHRLSRLALLTQGVALIGLGLADVACGGGAPKAEEPPHVNSPAPPAASSAGASPAPTPSDEPPHTVNGPPDDPPHTINAPAELTPTHTINGPPPASGPTAGPTAKPSPSASHGLKPSEPKAPAYVNSPAP